MQIGDPSYTQCPHCSETIEYYPGPFFVNYYGLTEWSDGETFEELPSLKETLLQKCNSCNKYYWFGQLLGGLSFDSYVEAVKYFEEEYSKEIILSSLDIKKRLLYIRLNILRKYNDAIRVHPLDSESDIKEVKSEYERSVFLENAKKLIPLLKILQPDNHLLIAEVYRNMGDFKEAKNEIYKLDDWTIQNLILEQIENENCDVITIKQPNKEWGDYY